LLKKVIGFFAVYDGHGGDKAAEYVRQHLHYNILQCENEMINEHYTEAITMKFDTTEKNFINLDHATEYIDGTTTAVVLVVQDKLFVAHTGDSRVALCRGKGGVPLSQDHKPDREDEQERIEKLGGRVETGPHTGFIPRVNGSLAVSRSIGDITFKREVQYVSPVPEISEYSLCIDDKFIIIASDGLWDVMEEDEAVYIVKPHFNSPMAAELLAKKAIKMGSSDNVTVLIVWLNWLVEEI